MEANNQNQQNPELGRTNSDEIGSGVPASDPRVRGGVDEMNSVDETIDPNKPTGNIGAVEAERETGKLTDAIHGRQGDIKSVSDNFPGA